MLTQGLLPGLTNDYDEHSKDIAMRLRENLLTESTSQLALREAIVVDPTTLIRDAVVLMRNERLGCVIVAEPADSICSRRFTPGIPCTLRQ